VWKTSLGGHVMLIDQPAVARCHQRAAILDVELEGVRLAASQEAERGGDDQFVLGEVFGGPREIDRNVAVMERGVEKLDVFAQVEKFIGLPGQ